MSKLKLCNQIVIAIATFSLIAISVSAQAEIKAKKTQLAKTKPMLVHIPLHVPVPLPLEPGAVFKDCDNCPDMVVIPEGSFDMGSDASAEKDEKPERRITIAQPFAMGKVEITKGQFADFVRAMGLTPDADGDDKCWMLEEGKWEKFAGHNWLNPGYTQDDEHPVACVNWFDAQAYVKWLSRKTGKQYQLPTESQWEYACKAGEHVEYCGNDKSDNVAWYDKNSDKASHTAATKQANTFGLYDMSGNVAEWVEDSYHDHYKGIPADGSAWAGDGATRVLRGGSWTYYQRGVRSAFRSISAPEYRYFDIGFRVVRMN